MIAARLFFRAGVCLGPILGSVQRRRVNSPFNLVVEERMVRASCCMDMFRMRFCNPASKRSSISSNSSRSWIDSFRWRFTGCPF
jgi:hypothetical protein